MSLILCRHEPAKHPFYFEGLGVHLYSSQELCYVIYNHPLLVMEDFVDDHLIEFIRGELEMELTAAKLEKWKQSGGNMDELLFLILAECDYYSAAEIRQFRQRIETYRKMPLPEFAKEKADYLFTGKQYGKAAAQYEKILKTSYKAAMDNTFLSGIYNNLGASCARLFFIDKAYRAYRKSYGLVKNTEVLKRIYYLSKWSPALMLKDRFHTLITDEMKAAWDEDIKNAEEEAEKAESVAQLEALFAKDPVKRLRGAGEMLGKWKTEYRTMI